MKKLLLAGCLSCMLLLLLSGCTSEAEEAESNIAYGQVVKTDENSITVKSGTYEYGGEFQGDGAEKTYTLPESVFYDDFKEGDIVSILCDGDSASAVSNVDDLNGQTASGGEALLTATTALVTSDGDEKSIADQSYSLSEDGKVCLLASGEDGSIDAERTSVIAGGENSCGLGTINGGSITGDQLTVMTTGKNSPAAASAAKGCTIDLTASTITTYGDDSACAASAGNISMSDVTASSAAGSIAQLLGSGVINFKNSNISSGGTAAIECSVGDAGSSSGRAKFIADNSSITASSAAALISVTGGRLYARMIQTGIDSDSQVLARVQKGDDGSGGRLVLYGVNQAYSGQALCDDASKLKLVLTESSSFKGALDPEGSAQYSKIYLSSDSSWSLTADSYADSIVDEDTSCANITSNGHNIYYDKDNLANEWLGGKTVELEGGGSLMPQK